MNNPTTYHGGQKYVHSDYPTADDIAQLPQQVQDAINGKHSN